MLEFGVHLDFDRKCVLDKSVDNHTLLKKISELVNKYIQKELKSGTMIGPFDILPFSAHISPFMTREKPDSNTRRAIIDLSCPKGQLFMIVSRMIHIWVQPGSYITPR